VLLLTNKMTTVSPDIFRIKVRTMLNTILQMEQKHANNLEKAIYNYTIQESNSKKIIKKWENPLFLQMYNDRLRTIYRNLKNEELLMKVRANEIKTVDLAFMTHYEMAPDKWAELIKQKMKRDSSKFVNGLQANTDMFICPNKKCRSKNCSYYELQTRSSDESMTIFVNCIDCGQNFVR